MGKDEEKGTTDSTISVTDISDLQAVETKLGLIADPEDTFFVRIVRILKKMNSA